MSETVMQIRDLGLEFPTPRTLVDVIRRRPARVVRALNGVSLTLERGKRLVSSESWVAGSRHWPAALCGSTSRSMAAFIIVARIFLHLKANMTAITIAVSR